MGVVTSLNGEGKKVGPSTPFSPGRLRRLGILPLPTLPRGEGFRRTALRAEQPDPDLDFGSHFGCRRRRPPKNALRAAASVVFEPGCRSRRYARRLASPATRRSRTSFPPPAPRGAPLNPAYFCKFDLGLRPRFATGFD